jgi:hypothetical protein
MRRRAIARIEAEWPKQRRLVRCEAREPDKRQNTNNFNHLTHRRKVMASRFFKSLGVNYLWGIANFTFGVVAGGIYVAVALIAAGLVR